MNFNNPYTQWYHIDPSITTFVENMVITLSDDEVSLQKIREFNQIKVLNAFKENRLSATDFYWTTGYGYGDIGRDKVEDIYKTIFQAESALVRPAIASGTHALSLVLFALLNPGDHLLSIAGTPYDTLLKVIGTKGESPGCLLEKGISYNEVDLVENDFDLAGILSAIQPETRMIWIQRSTGYSLRHALTIESMEKIIAEIKKNYPDIIIMVDNCYGEFTDIREPIEIGADICAGSLIKNPGGGIALSGGYIVGKNEWIERVANQLTAPGLGKATGLSFGTTRSTLQGLFLSPSVVYQALLSGLLFARVFDRLKFEVIPRIGIPKSDIVTAIILRSEERVIEFCQAIQEASAVDAFVSPIPAPMPGYSNDIIMASGSFIDGSSIEISADGPLRDPYAVYYQGALTIDQAKLAAMLVLQRFKEKNLIHFI